MYFRAQTCINDIADGEPDAAAANVGLRDLWRALHTVAITLYERTVENVRTGPEGADACSSLLLIPAARVLSRDHP